MKLLLLDNYDSFTYNLYHYLRESGAEVSVKRNDAIQFDEPSKYQGLVISPGPGLPRSAGLTMPVIERFYQHKAILGICLGAQALAEVFGAKLYQQKQVFHGLSRKVNRKENSWLLAGLPLEFKVGLYHSWAIDLGAKNTLEAKAYREGVLMAFEHPHLPLAGVQFHPESIMSEGGHQVIKNWLARLA